MIVSIGEVVWDIFSDRQVLGGAPVNVAYHLHDLKMDIKLVTRVGKDKLGGSTIQLIESLGIPSQGIQKDPEYQTGQVLVSVDQNNEPHFDIVAPAAWDFIDTRLALKFIGDEPFSLIYGTLAQRHATSRAAIRGLWQKATTRLYDINIRPPFTTRELVVDSLEAADVIKMNENEIDILAAWLDLTGHDKREAAQQLLHRFDLQSVIVTEGDAGAWLLTTDGIYEHPGYSVKVADTVGAGDAMVSGMVAGKALGYPLEACARLATAFSVAAITRVGSGLPPLEEVEAFKNRVVVGTLAGS